MMARLPCLLTLLVFLALGCAHEAPRVKGMMTTGYCPCGECNGYETGSRYFLYLDRWNKRLNYGAHKGEPYTGDTAGGHRLKTPRPGLLSEDSLTHPWRVPYRLVFPWLWMPRRGTIAADTAYYPFGTKMSIEGWGRGVVDDRGGAIKGPERLDLFFRSHRRTENWGRKWKEVRIE